MSNLIPLDLTILKTLVYFDCLDRALTATEAWQYLARAGSIVPSLRGQGPKQSRPDSDNHEIASSVPSALPRNDGGVALPSFLEVLKALEPGSSLRTQFVDQKNGYYFLKGREQLYAERIERLKIADQWWKKMRRIGRWMQLVPYVRLVMASGSLGIQHMTKDSDLDVLVVVKHGRIWTGRFLLTALVHLLGVRRHGKHIAGRVCLNHYITDESLHIPFHSLYNAMTYAQLVPIFENPKSEIPKRDVVPSGLYVRNPKQYPNPKSQISNVQLSLFYIFQTSNIWIKNYLPNWQPGGENLRTLKPSGWRVAVALFFEWWLDSVWGEWLEHALRRLQLRRIQRRPETYAPGGRVQADDMTLEFHPDSPEKTILDKFNKKMAELGLSEMGREKDSGLQ